ncbi:MAG: hypothetical protein J7J98_07615 [candidate division Zixibacteria bacterium]|nr:hypothetical protein [candidate division Zixibacteria bacterium]
MFHQLHQSSYGHGIFLLIAPHQMTDCTSTIEWTTYYEPEPDIYKEEEENLWMLSEYREWKAYIKSLWIIALRKKQDLNLFKTEQRIYCLRLMLPISGWIARAGYRKKRN